MSAIVTTLTSLFAAFERLVFSLEYIGA